MDGDKIEYRISKILTALYNCKLTEYDVARIHGMTVMPSDRTYAPEDDIISGYIKSDPEDEIVVEYNNLFTRSYDLTDRKSKMIDLFKIVYPDIDIDHNIHSKLPTKMINLTQFYTDGDKILAFWYLVDMATNPIEDEYSLEIYDRYLNIMKDSMDRQFLDKINHIFVVPRPDRCTKSIFNLISDARSIFNPGMMSVVRMGTMLLNPISHSMSPEMRVLDKDERSYLIDFMSSKGMTDDKFPSMDMSDPMRKLLLANIGDIIEIYRMDPMTNTLGNTSWRIVRRRTSSKVLTQYDKIMDI